MAAVTELLSTKFNKVLQDGNPLVIELASDTGGDIKPGLHAVPGSTPATMCGLAAAAAVDGIGIASDEGRLAIDSVIATGEVVRIYLWGSSALVAAFAELGTAQGTIGLRLIAGTATPGSFDWMDSDHAAVDPRIGYGRNAEHYLQIADENHAILINLSI